MKFKTLLFLLGVTLFCGESLHGAVEKESIITVFNCNFADNALNSEIKRYPDTSFVKTIRIYYRVNRTKIESGYMGNESTLDMMNQIFDENILVEGDFIVITGRASPEGDYSNNQRLAIERSLSLKNYIIQRHPQIKEEQIVTLSGGEDWDGLKEMIEKDMEVPSRDQLLKILKGKLSREEQRIEIQKLDDGKPYEYLLAHILPYLRGSVTGTIYFKTGEQYVLGATKIDTVRIHSIDTVEILRMDTVFIEKEVVRIDTICPDKKLEKQKRPFIIALKTNLIYDAALLPNLAVEIPFGHNYNWSFAIDGNWAWWNTNADSYYYYRIQIAGLEFRRWFANKDKRPLNGWYAGAYGYGGTYDIRLFTKKKTDLGQLSNWTYSAGLTVGYAMPVSKSLSLEFGLGLGYIGGKYYKYYVGDCEECAFPKLSTHYRHYWGPTKANISLVWLIGYGKQNKEKEEQQ